MGTGAIIGIVAGVVVLLVIIVLVARGGGGKADPNKRACGGCQRVMMPDWTKCLFCGWAPVPRLEFIAGPLVGQTFELTGQLTTLGSVAGNTIVLSDPAVSRKHIGINHTPAGYELADLGSTNGVYVNGHKMPKKLLASGDLLRVGNTEMVFKTD
jgi:hypothetical protein